MSDYEGRKQFLSDDCTDTANMQYFVDDSLMLVCLTSDGGDSFEIFTFNQEEFCNQIDSVINFLVEAKRAIAIRNVQQEQGET